MIMELVIEKIFAFVFLLVGASHLVQPGRWMEFFAWLRTKSFGAFIVVMYTLPVALVIVAFHNEWTIGPSLFITLAGWIMLVKCVVYALYPHSFNKVASKGTSVRNFKIAGIVAIIASLAVLLDIYLHPDRT